MRIHGVGLAIRTSLLPMLPELPKGISPRIMTLRVPLSNSRHLTVVSAYAPTLDAAEATKDDLYGCLHGVVSQIPPSD